MLNVLDEDKLLEGKLEELNKKLPEGKQPYKKLSLSAFGLYFTPCGEVHIIDTEGIGSEYEAKDDLFEPYINADNFLGPVGSLKIPTEQLPQYLKRDDEGKEVKVNLADFIRQFGSRLESNYHLWKRRLEPFEKTPQLVAKESD